MMDDEMCMLDLSLGECIPTIKQIHIKVLSDIRADCRVNNARMIKRLLTLCMAADWQLTYSVIQSAEEKGRQGSEYKRLQTEMQRSPSWASPST